MSNSIVQELLNNGILESISSIDPDYTSLALVGSAVHRKIELVNDFDFIALSPSVELPDTLGYKFSILGKDASVVFYAVEHWHIVSDLDSMLIYFYREIKKISRCEIIVDTNNQFLSIKNSLNSVKLPHAVVSSFITGSKTFDYLKCVVSARFPLYFSVEHLIFLILYAQPNNNYSKPKWILEDALESNSTNLHMLLQEIAYEANTSINIVEVFDFLTSSVEKELLQLVPNTIDFHFQDARFLIQQERLFDSIFAIRMGVFHLISHLARIHNIKYASILDGEITLRQLEAKYPLSVKFIRIVLLLDVAISDRIIDAYNKLIVEISYA